MCFSVSEMLEDLRVVFSLAGDSVVALLARLRLRSTRSYASWIMACSRVRMFPAPPIPNDFLSSLLAAVLFFWLKIDRCTIFDGIVGFAFPFSWYRVL